MKITDIQIDRDVIDGGVDDRGFVVSYPGLVTVRYRVVGSDRWHAAYGDLEPLLQDLQAAACQLGRVRVIYKALQTAVGTGSPIAEKILLRELAQALEEEPAASPPEFHPGDVVRLAPGARSPYSVTDDIQLDLPVHQRGREFVVQHTDREGDVVVGNRKGATLGWVRPEYLERVDEG